MNLTLDELLALLPTTQRDACIRIYRDNEDLFRRAKGSSHNHQAWEGGYLGHMQEVMNLAVLLWPLLDAQRPLPFSVGDALLVLWLHDLEKPWVYAGELPMAKKEQKRGFRLQKINEYEIALTQPQFTALRYVEGEGDDYSNQRRAMNELGAFCHVCDVISARIWFDHPRSE